MAKWWLCTEPWYGCAIAVALQRPDLIRTVNDYLMDFKKRFQEAFKVALRIRRAGKNWRQMKRLFLVRPILIKVVPEKLRHKKFEEMQLVHIRMLRLKTPIHGKRYKKWKRAGGMVLKARRSVAYVLGAWATRRAKIPAPVRKFLRRMGYETGKDTGTGTQIS
jgi:hypothetical protein